MIDNSIGALHPRLVLADFPHKVVDYGASDQITDEADHGRALALLKRLHCLHDSGANSLGKSVNVFSPTSGGR